MSEQDCMMAGMWYDANFDEGLQALRDVAKDKAAVFSACPYAQREKRERLLRDLIADLGKNVVILSPLYVDYGTNISIGDGTFINHDSYLMDCAKIEIGSMCFIGPHFGAYTAQHPLVADERNLGLERALPITIGDNCWIGANVSVMGGVSIGKGCVIGAGSLVTTDIPAGCIAFGAPCRVVREIGEADRIERLGNDV